MFEKWEKCSTAPNLWILEGWFQGSFFNSPISHSFAHKKIIILHKILWEKEVDFEEKKNLESGFMLWFMHLAHFGIEM